MAANLTLDDVRRVAALAHLTLTESEVETFAAQLGDILDWVNQIQATDTAGVDASHASMPTRADAWRDDVAVPSLRTADVIEGAPDAVPAAGLFRVPSVF
ncbi:MAG TPA: Asp-tRNA(Asn)/Glu-tRNA(Gln) amidotransferase subunit GatC [Vicinamibacterales bacterium]|nr:Asp-tRNA(Asn)/Glu-tRNA(Gln) amidotransferase subunit GatC [Vicinamibacterales bacterium]